MPTPRPNSDRIRLELDILASELDGDERPLAAPPLSLGGAPPEDTASRPAPDAAPPEASGDND